MKKVGSWLSHGIRLLIAWIRSFFKSQFGRIQMSVGHVTYAYPTAEQAAHAGTELGKMLIGLAPKNTSEMIAHAYCVVGYGCSLGFPVAPQSTGQDFSALSDEELGRLLDSHFGMGAPDPNDPQAFPWLIVFEIAFELLKRFIKK